MGLKHALDHYFMKFFYVIIAGMFFLLCYHILQYSSAITLSMALSKDDHHHRKPTVFDSMDSAITLRQDENHHSSATDYQCTYWKCFKSRQCVGKTNGKISVYVYDLHRYVDENSQELIPSPSKEFLQLLWAISNSKFAVRNVADACILIPSIDLLNVRHVQSEKIAKVLHSLPYWENGSNHILFNMVSGINTSPKNLLGIETGKALVAASDFTTHSYRRTFDISIPFFNPYLEWIPIYYNYKERELLLVCTQIQFSDDIYAKLAKISRKNPGVLVLHRCQGSNGNTSERCDISGTKYLYPEVLSTSRYCLVTYQGHLVLSSLHDILRSGCIPVIGRSDVIMPFSEVLDWKRAAIFINEHALDSIVDTLTAIDQNAYVRLQNQGRFYYETYMQSIDKIALTALEILNDRILPYHAKDYNYWNRPIIPEMPRNPFFIPLLPSQKQGYTAVILAYDRVELLQQVVQNIAGSKHLVKIVIIWNNQEKKFPSILQWESIKVPVRVIETKHNRLSNRFYPYKEIETDCVLSIDDDIIMVPPSELDFGYRVWSENSDRLVGYPPRHHIYNNTEWKYESEWMNNISMVLTGVAFYHKYYHYLFVSHLPNGLKTWIDENMNCEDVAMNYLISNVTGKAPIKVLARKKFKPTASGGLSAGILTHFGARNTCMKIFTQAFGNMPLRTVEFRADPVLYKINHVDESLQWYPSDGAL